MKTTTLAALLAATAFAAPALAGPQKWTLDGEASAMGFVTVKNGDVAESHTFSDLSGTVDAAGAAEVSIPLASVETLIDIRNERMREFLFKVADFPAATVTADVALAEYDALAPGARMMSTIEVVVAANGAEASYDADVAVTRIADGMVSVSTVRPMIADARDLGYEDGVAKLQELAGLDAISPAVPVTFDLVFTR